MQPETTTTITPEQQQAFDAVYQNVFAQLNNGGGEDSIKASLLASGFDDATATTIYENARTAWKQAHSKKANKDILYGGLWLFGGIIVTAVTYSKASEGGGSYVVTWGAIIFGGIQFFRGLINKNNYL